MADLKKKPKSRDVRSRDFIRIICFRLFGKCFCICRSDVIFCIDTGYCIGSCGITAVFLEVVSV